MDWFSGDTLTEFIKAVGYLGIFSIVFAESGLFIGFFLPGDSLLFTAGLLASQGYMYIDFLLIAVFVGAVLGDSAGYAFGKTVGPKLFNREDSFLFHKDNLIRAQKFYEKYGVMTIILARFMPIIRTFAPIVAGIGQMRYSTFVTYNVIGGLIWTLSLTLSGYYLASLIPGIEQYLTWIIIAIVIASVIPPILHYIKERHTR